MPCGGVPHDHDLGHVAELGEILFQAILSGLPRETADEHLSGDWIMVNGHYLFRLMSDDGDDCGDEEHLSRDWKHHYLFRLASPPCQSHSFWFHVAGRLQTSLTIQDFLPRVIAMAR